jgi:hypothetical protein
LIEKAQSVTHASVSFPCKKPETLLTYFKRGFPTDALQVIQYVFKADALEVMPLASRQDRDGNSSGLSSGKDEEDMGRRFLQRFQKGIERFRRKHVDFVDDIDLEPAVARHVFDVLSKFTDFVNAPVGGTIDFKHIDRNAIRNLFAGRAHIAWDRDGTFLAVHGLGKNTGHRGLSDAPWAGKKQGMSNPVPLDSVLQGLRYMSLSNDLFKGLGAVFSR